MSSNTNLDFVKFVKNKKHAKPDDDELYEIDFLGRKKEGISFNDTNRNDVKKLKIKDGEISLADLLSKNKNKIIEEPKRKENKEKNKKEEKKEEKDSEDEDDYSKENDSYNESDDYSEDKINHYIGHKREGGVDEMEEIINEIKNRSERPNKHKEDSNSSDSENSDKDENEGNNDEKEKEEKEENSEENGKKEHFKKKKEKKKKKQEKKKKKVKKYDK